MGHPLQIDLTDCDVRLPSPYEILRFPTDPPSDPHAERPFSFNTEMLKISILFGRVMKTIYSPTGLMKATDEEITGLLGDMDRWFDNLPTELRFSGPESSAPAGEYEILFRNDARGLKVLPSIAKLISTLTFLSLSQVSSTSCSPLFRCSSSESSCVSPTSAPLIYPSVSRSRG